MSKQIAFDDSIAQLEQIDTHAQSGNDEIQEITDILAARDTVIPLYQQIFSPATRRTSDGSSSRWHRGDHRTTVAPGRVGTPIGRLKLAAGTSKSS